MKNEKPKPITIHPDEMGLNHPIFNWFHKEALGRKMKTATFMKLVMSEAYEKSVKKGKK